MFKKKTKLIDWNSHYFFYQPFFSVINTFLLTYEEFICSVMISLLNNIGTTFLKRDTRDIIVRRGFIFSFFVEIWRHEYYVYRKFNLYNLKAIFLRYQ